MRIVTLERVQMQPSTIFLKLLVSKKNTWSCMLTIVLDRIRTIFWCSTCGIIILTGKNESMEISFMIKGHTKLAPDRFFGVLKSYRHTSVSTLDEIVNVVRKSMIAVQNIPQLTKTAQRRLVNWYDRKSFLSKYFQHIPAITGYHHFCFDQNFPGCLRTSASR